MRTFATLALLGFSAAVTLNKKDGEGAGEKPAKEDWEHPIAVCDFPIPDQDEDDRSGDKSGKSKGPRKSLSDSDDELAQKKNNKKKSNKNTKEADEPEESQDVEESEAS